MARQLIVSADDFGASSQINDAVAKAFREGILTSAGLMVGGEAVSDAVAWAKNESGLAIGLHLALSDSRSVLPHELIPDIVNANNRFANNPATAGLRYYMSKRAQRQLKCEIEAQFEAFSAIGLTLSHVDGHQHLHVHPIALPIIIALAVQYGAKGIRIPHDPFWANISVNRSRPIYKLLVGLSHAYLSSIDRSLIGQSGLATCGAVVGSMMSGQMDSVYVIRILERLPHKKIELYFHPSTSSDGYEYGPNLADLNTLIDPNLRSFIARRYEMATYCALNQDGIGDVA